MKIACPACGSLDIDKFVRPYCSCMCRSLGIRGLLWRTNPYRVIDMETRTVLAQGPYINLSPGGLSELVIRAKAIRRAQKLRLLRKVTELEQINRSIGGSFSIPGLEIPPAA